VSNSKRPREGRADRAGSDDTDRHAMLLGSWAERSVANRRPLWLRGGEPLAAKRLRGVLASPIALPFAHDGQPVHRHHASHHHAAHTHLVRLDADAYDLAVVQWSLKLIMLCQTVCFCTLPYSCKQNFGAP
jgi:hypothetical protein